MTSAGDFRIGNDDRERAVAELRRAAEDGRLSAEELDERTSRARAARTAAELAVVTADLQPGAGPGSGIATTAGQAAVLAALGQVGQRPDDPLVLSAGFDSEKRSGQWVVPPFLRVQALFDTVKIDCLQARPGADVIDLEVQPGAGTCLLVLPEGWAVNTDRLGKGIGTITVRVAGLPAPGCPLFVVHGSLGIGTFKARPANRFDRWRLRRLQQRAISSR